MWCHLWAGMRSLNRARPSHQRARGFTLLEMAIVLVIIGVVTSAVMIGTDVLRHAKGQNVFATFVAGWNEAFTQYVRAQGRVPGSTAAEPNRINAVGSGNPLCGAALSNAFLSARIRIPEGRGNALESEYLYQDSNGSPHTLRVCFLTVTNWSVQGDNVNSFAHVSRHVMRFQGLTTELAIQLDVLIDGRPSARFGQFRRSDVASLQNSADVAWGAAGTNEVTADLELY